MMPSRGFGLARGKLPRLFQQQYRNLSSRTLRSPQRAPCSVVRTSQPWRSSIPSGIIPLATRRHASTTPSAPPAQSTAPALPPTENAAFPNLDTITLDNIDLKDPALDITSIPEGVGYLKQIGIDYGIGPTSGIEWLLEHVHIWGNLPWWASIVATAAIIRIVMFPLYLKSSDMMARQSALVSVTKPITDRMTSAQKAGNTQEVMIAYRQLGMIRKKAGISMPQQLAPLLIQGVIGYCGFKLMRACSTLPVPGFVDGGFLWLQDLTLTDGYLLMPLIMAGTIHLVVRLGGETGAAANTMPPGMKKVMLYGMPAMVALVTIWQPGAVCVWFAASGLLGILQGQALQRRSVRAFFGLAPLYKPKPGEAQAANPLSAMLQQQTESLTGRSSSSSSPGNQATRPAFGSTANKTPSSMNPTYQSPTLNTKASSRTIDTTLVAPQPAQTSVPASEMIQPNVKAAPKPSAFSAVTDKVNETKSKGAKASHQLKQEGKEGSKRRAANHQKPARRGGR